MSHSRVSSRDRNAPQHHHNHSERSIDIIPPGPDNFTSPQAPVSAAVADLLALPIEGSRSRPHSRLRDVIDFDDSDSSSSFGEPDAFSQRVWYKTPSPWWILPLTAMATLFMSMTLGPRTEIYIRLVCAEVKPEFLLIPPVFPTFPFELPPSGPQTPPTPSFLDDFTAQNMTLHHKPKPQINVPRPVGKCAKDPEVQTRVAELTTAIAFITGVLSCITSGWWGHISDKYGRTRVMGAGVLGVFCSDLIVIAVTMASDKLPGGYSFLLLAAFFDGLMGGMYTGSAAAHAYVSDCADPSARAQLFSLYMGVVFIGMSVGPTLGGLLVKHSGDLLSVFYIAALGHFLFFFMAWFVIPESLSAEVMQDLAEQKRVTTAASVERRARRVAAGAKERGRAKAIFLGLVAPIKIFFPRKREVGEPGKGRDWNLTFICVAIGATSVIISAYPFKIQYTTLMFGWGSEEIGYWLTSVGIVRAFHLIVLLPTAIRLFGPRFTPLGSAGSHSPREHDPTRPLLSERPTPLSRAPSATPSHHHRHHAHHTAKLDLHVAFISLFFDIIAYILIMVSVGAKSFGIVSVVTSLGSGFAPAAQSLALGLMPRGGEDAGKLFGGLAAVQALSAQIIGPTLFGTTYIASVATFPKSIFLLSGIFITIAIMALSVVRLPPPRPTHPTHPHPENVDSAEESVV